jgi:hypothetical protein
VREDDDELPEWDDEELSDEQKADILRNLPNVMTITEESTGAVTTYSATRHPPAPSAPPLPRRSR